ncbi:MAG: penicillin-binding protein 2 [Pseudomonadales bacterium]|nr:penicillin-binding protein 2 [Pseudomonadales bacterium]
MTVGAVRIKDRWGEQRLFEQRSLIAAIVIFLLTSLLIARLVVLQVVRHDYYTELSAGNRVRLEPLPAPRGLILDRHGKVMADNQPAFQLELVREQVPDVDATLRRLVEIGLLATDDLEDVRRTILSRRKFEGVPIRLRMTDEEIARFAVHRFEFPGVDIATRLARSYPQKEIAVHALGYVAAISESDLKRIDTAAYAGTTLIGKLGIESSFENQLHGTNGSREILVNAAGRSVERAGGFVPDLHRVAPVAGEDIITSIDLETQRIAEDALIDRRGSIVAIDPENGDVIALVSRPGFDPNAFGRGLTRAEFAALNENIDRPLLNRALKGAYPPGSTIKPIVALAGLAYGVTTPEHSRVCGGYFTLPGSRHRFRDWKAGGHGRVDMLQAIAQSCDVYFYDLAAQIGVDRLAEFLGHFGLGALTGIDISGEKRGLLPTPAWKRKAFPRPADQVWFPGETVIFGIGQGYLTTTPLQMAHAAAIIAARGKSYQPRLVTALKDPVTNKIRALEPKLIEQVEIAQPEAWDVAIGGMIKVMNGGTASRSQAGAKYQIAGKTGTAQVFSIAQNAKYDEAKIDERLRDHAWFIAFAPADAPKIAVAVMVENGRSGSGTAAPIARRVIDTYLLGAPTTELPARKAIAGAAAPPPATE